MAASTGNVVFRVNNPVNTSVKVTLELGHTATVREELTPEGFTHDWVVFVRGPHESNIEHFVDKVVFQLSDKYPRPRRIVASFPFEVHECGSSGFLMPIEVHFKSEHEPKKVIFPYDLSFTNVAGMPPVNHIQRETLTFHNPNGDFKRKIIQAGGTEIASDFHADEVEDDSDIWDDTELIKAYDKAINSFKVGSGQGAEEELSEGKPKSNKHAKRYKKKKKRKNKWKIGDQCQAVFSEDGQLYNAVIKSINYKTATCWVTYIGYGNEEEQNIADLMAAVHIDNNASAQENDYDSSMDYSMEYSTHPPGQANADRPSSRGSQQQQLRAAFPGWHPPAPPFPSPFMPPFPPAPPAWGMAPYQTPQFPQGGMPAGFPFVHMPHSQNASVSLPAVPPPPAPDVDDADDTGIHSMLMAWYMSGYHTGYYQGLRQGKRLSSSNTTEPKHEKHHHSPMSSKNNPAAASIFSDSNNSEDDTR